MFVPNVVVYNITIRILGFYLLITRFPKDNARKQEWAMSIHRADPVSGKLWMPSQWDMICSQHFSPECFREINGKKFLKEESCPSIFSFPDTSKV